MAELASARPLELEVPGSILGDLNICFNFPLTCVVIASNTREIKGAPSASIDTSFVTEGTKTSKFYVLDS